MSKSIKTFFDGAVSSKSNKKARTEKIDEPTIEEQTIAPSAEHTTSDSVDDVESVPSDFINWDALDASWKVKLAVEHAKPYFKTLQRFLNAESKTQTIFPPKNQVFSAFNLCPFDNVKVSVLLLSVAMFYQYCTTFVAGRGDWTRPISWRWSSPRLGFFGAARRCDPSFSEEHDQRSKGAINANSFTVVTVTVQ